MKQYAPFEILAGIRPATLLWAVIAPLAAMQAQSNYATPYTFTTLAGDPGHGTADGTGSAARFSGPSGIAVDTAGDLYVADTLNLTIRRISPAGVVTTLAGSPGISGTADGTGSAARFEYPTAVTIDQTGNLYVADKWASSVRKVTPAGVVTTFPMGFYQPTDLKVDASGNIYVVSSNGIPNAPPGSSIVKVTPAGVQTTVLFLPRYDALGSMAFDSDGNIFVSVTTSGLGTYIKKVTPTGVVTLFAGSTSATGFRDGVGDAARFNRADNLIFDAAGTLYVNDAGHIRKISPLAEVTTLATTAVINPAGLTLDASGNIYATSNNMVVRITAAGVVTAVAGMDNSVPPNAEVDATGAAARFNLPTGVAVAADGTLYVADLLGATIRKVTPAGEVTTLAGMPYVPGFVDGTGSEARLTYPNAIALDASGNLYVSELHSIRKVTPAGVVTTVAGSDLSPGWADGLGLAARFYFPTGVAVDGLGNVFVADRQNHIIRKITPDGNVTTFAGGIETPGTADGTGEFARFYEPAGLAIDSAGNLYVADQVNCTIRKVTPARVVTTVAGAPGQSGSDDGVGGLARFNHPSGVAIDSTGYLYVCEFNNTIRRISPAGEVTTIGGLAGISGADDGAGSLARFNHPTGLAVGAGGTVYIADSLNWTVRAGLLPPAAPTITTQPTNRRVLAGGSVAFSVEASGMPAPTYQWRKNGTPIGGATGSSLVISNVADSDAGNYSVVVSNTQGSTISNVAMLFVGALAADFNADGQTDILWENVGTGERGFWTMNGTVPAAWIDLPTVGVDWHIVGTGDFNNDGQPDILWEDLISGEHGIWIMNGTIPAFWINLPTIPTDWHIAGTGDFNGDGQTDILWENLGTGEHGIWIMNGTVPVFWINLPTIPTDWHMVGTGDFNGDGQSDILWEDLISGEHGIWIMSGTVPAFWINLPTIPTAWHIAGAGDFNGDGQTDILWENVGSGDRGLWLMSGTVPAAWINLPSLALDWRIAQ